MRVLYPIEQGDSALYAWSEMDDKTRAQIFDACRLPSIVDHVALMPDAHCGYGVPIGSVVPTRDIILPYAVGVDIGCGVTSVRCPYLIEDFIEHRHEIAQEVAATIPLGFHKYKEPLYISDMPRLSDSPVIRREWANASHQLGTLGGGNHFIEFQFSSNNNYLYVMIHSGSRNIGKQVCYFWNARAKDQNPNGDLSWLDVGSQSSMLYLEEMNWCKRYALANRKKMVEIVTSILSNHLKDVSMMCPGSSIDTVHNYVSMETHYGEDCFVHRKGAVRAPVGSVVVIPGSMGTASYLAGGLGRTESFESCSHGAGRRMGRREAKRTYNYEDILEDLAKKDILVVKPDITTIADECDAAYKNIEDVMKDQKDLVKIMNKLMPLAVIKG